MKKTFLCLVLLISLFTHLFADNAQAHKELKQAFKYYGLYPELVKTGFELDKLDELNTLEEFINYLQPFFINENDLPFDQHAFIKFSSGTETIASVKTQCQMFIDFSDDYGTRETLLEKGYTEDEIFYYPYFNDTWNEDGYRAGKKFVGDPVREFNYKKYYSVEAKNALLVGIHNFEGHRGYYNFTNQISKSKKKYLILDLSNNGGGEPSYYQSLVYAIQKMKPQEIFVLCDYLTFSMGEYAVLHLEKDCGVKTTVIGYPTGGGLSCDIGDTLPVVFDDFKIRLNLGHEPTNEDFTEGVGITPKYYANNTIESLEIVKHLIKERKLSLPEDYIENIKNNSGKKWE